MAKATTSAISAVSGLAPTQVVDALLADLYSLLKKQGGDTLKLMRLSQSSQKLRSHVVRLRKVKTLWQVDHAVDLGDFYCQSFFRLGKRRVALNALREFGDRPHVVITGTAGQGKSIFLRYLCSQSLANGESLPIFLELRRIQAGETIYDHIVAFYEVLGVSGIERKLVLEGLNSGKIALFLDGFDEVAEDARPALLHELEHLVSTCPELRVVITSRPDTGLEASPLLEVVRMENLKSDEYKAVIKKLASEDKFADNLIRQVESHRGGIRDLLSTPLLVTLLVMSYKAFQELPEQMSEFYDSIFQILLQRHDGSKPGFKRAKRCKLNDAQYRSAFEGTCYYSKRIKSGAFKKDDLIRCASKSLEQITEAGLAERFVEDIVKVTCLILCEGDEYRYIHKSVQEYYAAAFVKHRSDATAKKFYDKSLQLGMDGPFRAELKFLSEIDRYRYAKYYALPLAEEVLGTPLPNQPPGASGGLLSQIFESTRWHVGNGPGGGVGLWGLTFDKPLTGDDCTEMLHWDYTVVLRAIEAGKIQAKKGRGPFKEVTVREVGLDALLEDRTLRRGLMKIAVRVAARLHAEGTAAANLIAREDAVDVGLGEDWEI